MKNVNGNRWWLWIFYAIGAVCLVHDFMWIQQPSQSDFSNGAMTQVMMSGE